MASRSKSDKYWLANNPNCELTDAKSVKLAELSATGVTLAELNGLDADSMSCAVTPASASVADGATVEFVVQFSDAAGAAVDHSVTFNYYVSSLSTGLDVDTAVTTIADGGAGVIIPITANQTGIGITDATGTSEIDITEAGADTVYLVVSLPDGRIAVSTAVAWAA